jgi:hypothetical protein
MPRPLTDSEKVQLEELIDTCGTYNVLDSIGEICMEKGEHVRSTYQDVPLGKAWEAQSRLMDGFTTTMCKKLPGAVT